MKKKITIGAIIALVVAIISYLGILNKMSRNDDEEVIRIGVILPLTGVLSQEGENCQAAVKLAENEINHSDIFPFKVKLLIEDSKFTSKDSLLAFNKILLEDADALVVFGTPPTQSIKERVNKVRIPLLAIDGTSGLAKHSEWIFECFPPFSGTGEAAGKFINDKNWTNGVGLLTMNSSGGDDFAKGFIKQFVANTEITHEQYESNSQNIRAQIIKLLSANPQSICVFGFGSGYTTAINQILELGYKGKIVTDSNITSIADKLKDKNKDIYFVSHNYGRYANNEKGLNFINTMASKPNIEPTSFSAHLYDMIMMIATSTMQKEQITPEAIKIGLLSMKNYSSLFGEVSFDKDGNLYIPQIIVKLQNGVYEIVETNK